MGKINKNIRIDLLESKASKRKVGRKEKHKFASLNVTTEKAQLIMNKTITPKKTKSKKEKYRQRHTNLMNKFSLMKKQLKEEKARKNREKTAVVGDLKPLKDALPSMDDIFLLSKNKSLLKTGVKEFDAKVEEKLSAKQKIKKKKQNFIKQIESFQSVLRDPEFKKNPREAIRYHIQYTHGLIKE